MDFVVGSTGRLGKTIVHFLSPSQAVAVEQSTYASWWHPDGADAASFYFEKKKKNSENGVVYVAAGVLDPSRVYDEHHRINFLLPKNIIEGANRVGLRTVTFGTVMEKVVGTETSNPYILSKTKLGHLVSECLSLENPPLHIRMHTLYGVGLPSPFMFLGQILKSLLNQTPFNMSPGNQLREYHHLHDEIKAIHLLVTAQVKGAIELSHGEAVSLKEIAHFVFKYFDCLHLLNIGASTAPIKENYNFRFQRPDFLTTIAFRETLPALVDYLCLCKQIHGELTCLS
ncbi:NAD-dependent epimerase/dehydratase family protein [Legionella micdadei]|uniref:Nucleoside-diphosphate-sugar epimerase n=1 Tax=Legionella micdadei TaxID=451 RepID=A0A098GK26_LEGMI|nr:NAD-dependent epimerase/dehydratase family protein [Legionella micdadei]KTD28958.1 hypothetical protein Lmic_0878 [Legionella micdadei]CEG62340.1 Nucleoside-diphosphate-sugar epimerase [Legionella micdadei]SCY03047.1 Nucleoside-diphosphate-sugar epimerase [Legionella micdadei]